MELLDVQLRVPGYLTLDEPTRAALRNLDLFQTLPLRRAEQVWGGPVPSGVCFSAQVHDSAVFITEGWAFAIRGPNLIDCVVSMCAIANILGQELGCPIGIDLPEQRKGSGNVLYRALDRQRAMRRARAVGLWILTLAAGGLVGALLQWILTGGL